MCILYIVYFVFVVLAENTIFALGQSTRPSQIKETVAISRRAEPHQEWGWGLGDPLLSIVRVRALVRSRQEMEHNIIVFSSSLTPSVRGGRTLNN